MAEGKPTYMFGHDHTEILPLVDTGSVRIIIADDDDWAREHLGTTLASFGFIIAAEARDGAELIKTLEDTMADLVILDLSMPYMNGEQAFRIIRKRFPNIKVIILSMFGDDFLMWDYIKAGACAFCLKRDLKSDLYFAGIVQDVMEKGCHLDNLPPERKSFTNREHDIISQLTNGHNNKEIAGALKVSPQVISRHQKNILKKTETRSVFEFLIYAIKKGYEFLLRDRWSQT